MASTADNKTGLAGVAEAAKQAPGRGLPPVHLWHPAHCGAIDIVIRRDGVWVGSSRVDLQACKLEYSIVSPK